MKFHKSKGGWVGEARRMARPLVVGDALQICEYVLNLHQTLFEGGHGKHRQLVARVDGKHSQEPPAASRTVGRRLEEWKSGRTLRSFSFIAGRETSQRHKI